MKNKEDKKREFLERAQKILEEIEKSGEFKGIKKPVYVKWFPIELLKLSPFKETFSKDCETMYNPIGVLRENVPSVKKALDNIGDFSIFDEVEPIFFNPLLADPPLWEYSDEEIKDLLRHELLHAELHAGDDSIEFVREAIKRNIFIHTDHIMRHVDSYGRQELVEILKYLDDRRKDFPAKKK